MCVEMSLTKFNTTVLFIDFYLASPTLRITERTFIVSVSEIITEHFYLGALLDICKYHGEV